MAPLGNINAPVLLPSLQIQTAAAMLPVVKTDDAALVRQSPAMTAFGSGHAKRNVNGPTSGGVTFTTTPTATALGQQSTSSTSTSSAATATDTSLFNSLFGGGLPTNVLNYVAIFLVVLVVFTLVSARYIFLKRYGPVGFREYFIPTRGIHFKWLGIHIRGPPDRRPALAASSLQGYMGARGDRRRRRRGRDTTGADIGEGGRRGGPRDADDGDSIISASELPKYEVDTSLPGYNEGLTTTLSDADRTSHDSTSNTDDAAALPASTATATSTATGQPADAQMTDVQRYEAQSRGIAVPEQAHTASEGEVHRPTAQRRPPLVSAPSANPPPSYEMQEMRQQEMRQSTSSSSRDSDSTDERDRS